MSTGIALENVASLIAIQREDPSIVAELKAGSEEAFSWLIAKYHKQIFSVIARTIPNPADAADLTQDVFLKVYRGIGRFNGGSSLQTWIYRIALREASNQRRWWGRHKRCEITMESEIAHSKDGGEEGRCLCIKDTLADAQESPFEHAAQQELRTRVVQALHHVPEPFRTTVVLRDIEGFSYEEVAEILDINIGTVKSRLMRGRKHLKTHLAEFTARASERPVRTLDPQLLLSAEEAR